MKRREFIGIAGGAAAWPLGARAQQKPMLVIGLLGENPGFTAGIRQGLGEAGYVEGQNVTFEHRGAEGRYDQFPALAADLVGRKVDLIVTGNGTPSALAAKSATSTIPIVFTFVSDPVGDGLVASLSHPGGNVTGFGTMAIQLAAKRLELLSELVPRASVIALLVNPDNPNAENTITAVRDAARVKQLKIPVLKAASESEIDSAFAMLAQLRAGALVFISDRFLSSRHNQLVALASRHSVPVIGEFRSFATAGGLIAYGPNITAMFRQAGVYAGRILKGEKPADLPVQQPTQFELVINLKTAKALGLTVPQSLLVRADEVIE